MPKKIPNKILDSTLKDTIFTDQYGVGLNKRVQSLLKSTEDEIVAAIAKNDPTSPTMTKWKAARLEKLQAQISDIVKTGYKDISSLTRDELTKLAKTQAKNVVKKFNNAVGVDVFQVTLTPDNVKSIAQNTLIDGATIKQWWDKQSTDTQQRLSKAMAAGTQALQIGMVQGESVGELVSRIRGTKLTPGIMSISKRDATSLVRTSVMQVANVTRQETYKANADVLDGFEFIATLDARTCPKCRPYDGKKYDMDMNPVGHNLPFPGTPAHFNCRCTTMPVTKSWSELAGPKSSLPKDQIKSLNNIPSGKRSAMNGPVSGNMTYDDWLRDQPESVQKDILGPGKFKLWSENKLDSVDLVNNNGRALTIKELQAKLGMENVDNILLQKAEKFVEPKELNIEVENYTLPGMHRDTVNFFKKKILKKEIIPPVYVEEGNIKHIIDGNHRAAAFKSLKKKIPIVEVPYSQTIQELSKLEEDLVSWYQINIK